MHIQHPFTSFVRGAILACCLAPAIAAGGESGAFHRAAWERVTESAAADPYSRYGIYASRTLAVMHPEIYLRADMLFLKTVERRELAACVFDLPSTYRMDRLTFSLDGAALRGYAVEASSSSYPPGCPFLGYLDRRMLSPAATLRRRAGAGIGRPGTIRQIELASLFYANERRRSDAGDVFVIYCGNEEAFVVSGDIVYAMRTLNPWRGALPGDPVLIFSEESVWYPLMGRDDTARDVALAEAVRRFRGRTVEPALTPFERNMIPLLADATALRDRQIPAAVIAAARVSSSFGFKDPVTDGDVLRLWQEVLPGIPAGRIVSAIPPHPLGGVDDAILEHLAGRANELSPIAALLADRALSGGAPLETLSRTYRELGFAWNCLWTLGFEALTIDESYSSGGGTCETHAHNVAAALDLAGIGNIIVHTYEPGGSTHQVVYVPAGGMLFTNGFLKKGSRFASEYPRALFKISKREGWAFISKGGYQGTLAPERARALVKLVWGLYPGATGTAISVEGDPREIPLAEAFEQLGSSVGQWRPVELP